MLRVEVKEYCENVLFKNRPDGAVYFCFQLDSYNRPVLVNHNGGKGYERHAVYLDNRWVLQAEISA